MFKKDTVLKTFTDQPMLWEMTKKALAILGNNANGFFLMVEGGSIDKQAHVLDWERTVWDTIEMDKAVGVAKRWAAANGNNTLIIVTADHAHGMSITGTYWEGDGKKGREAVRVYANAKFPDYQDTDGDGFPDKVAVTLPLAIHWANHPEFYENYHVNDEPLSPTVQEGDKWVANEKRNSDGELQTGNLPWSATNEVHTVEDVPLTASGPGAEQFHKTIDNTEVARASDVNDGVVLFTELYKGRSSRGLVFSDKLVALNGKRVVMTGFMAPPLKPALDFFVLTRMPLSLCPFCASDAEWPEDIIFVRMPLGKTIQPTSATVRVTGQLDIGTKTDEATGFVSLVRIAADGVQVLR